MRSTLALILAGAWVAGAALPAGANTYYASPNGDDMNPGTMARPWRSLLIAKKNLKPGDTLLIADGEYVGGVWQNRGGQPGLPITYKAVNPGQAIVRGDLTSMNDCFTIYQANWVVVDGLTFDNASRAGIWVASSNNVIVRNCVSRDNHTWGIFTSYSDDLLLENNQCSFNAKGHGIYISNSGDRPVVRYNVCHDNGGSGIQLNGDGKQLKPALGTRGDGIIRCATIDSNIVYNNGALGGGALNILVVCDSLISNNLIFDNLAGGIALYNDNVPSATQWGSKNNTIVANTIYFKPSQGRWLITFSHGCTDNVVGNNILNGGARGAFAFDASSSFTSDHNLIYSPTCKFAAVSTQTGKWLTATDYQNQTGNDTHSVYADPKFVSPAATAPDYHLLLTSPARRAGVYLDQVSVDADGKTISDTTAPDLGCFGAASTTSSTPSGA